MINIDGVSKHYIVRGGDGGDKSKSIVALDKVNATIARGEFISLLGPSGCGKTTLLRIAAGLTHCSEGSLSIGGQLVTGDRKSVVEGKSVSVRVDLGGRRIIKKKKKTKK